MKVDTLLVLTGDRPAQLACCLTSLLFQIPGATIELWDNSTKYPVLEDGMLRGVLELGMEMQGWQLCYRRQKAQRDIGALFKEATGALPEEGLVLWTDDDLLWHPMAVSHLIRAASRFRAVEPVVIDIVDRGFPDYTSVQRVTVEEGIATPSPARHLYLEGTLPFEVPFLSSILLCRAEDLKGIWKAIPSMSDVISTLELPDPKAIVPAAECYHMAHTRPDSAWTGYSIPMLWKEGWLDLHERERGC